MKLQVSKLFVLLLVVAMLLGIACPALATEPEDSPADAQQADVLPVPEPENGPEDDSPVQIIDAAEPENPVEGEGMQAGMTDVEEAPSDGENVMFAAGLSSMDDGGGGSKVNVVFDSDELRAWLSANKSGTVKLGCPITISRATAFYGPVTIETGEYGLVFNGGYLHAAMVEGEDYITRPIRDHITIRGEGEKMPVVEVQSLGYLWVGSWLDYLYPYNITATGNAQGGGTAMYISGTVNRPPTFGAVGNQWDPGKIYAYGEGAIGLKLNSSVNMNIVAFDITVEGKDSTAVLAPQGTSVCFSRLSAKGSGARTISGSNVTVDTCIADPAPQGEGIDVYTSKLFPTWQPVKLGDTLPQRIDAIPVLSGCSSVTLTQVFSVDWADEVVRTIDTSVPGVHTVTGELASGWYKEFLTGTPTVVIEVRDPDDPCVFAVWDWDDEGGVLLNMWRTEAWTYDECTVWRSLDGGKTWEDCTGEDGVEWHESKEHVLLNGFSLSNEVIGGNAMFLVEAPDGRESNLVRFSDSEGQTVRQATGGDRIGTDRVAVALGGQKPTWPDDDEGEEPPPTTPGKVDDVPKGDPGSKEDDIPEQPEQPEQPGIEPPDDTSGGQSAGTTGGQAGGTAGGGGAKQVLYTSIGSTLWEDTIATPEQAGPVLTLPESNLVGIEDAPIPAAERPASAPVDQGPAPQPVLSEPATGTAITVAACVTAASLAGWFLLRKIKVMKR